MQTVQDLRQFMLLLFLSLAGSCFAPVLHAEDPPSAVGSMLTLLKSGRVPEQRLGAIVKLICDRGNEHDLRYVFDQLIAEAWSEDLRLSALQQLVEASKVRNLRPAGELGGLTQLFQSTDPALRKTAIEIAGLWKVSAAFAGLQSMVSDPASQAELKALAMLSMAQISPEQTRSLLIEQAQPTGTFATRSQAINVLTTIDLTTAAGLAAQVLLKAEGRDDPSLLLNGFLDRESGSKVLSEAIQKTALSPDTAKLALRHMFSIGRADAELSAVLSHIAGIQGEPQIPGPEELAALVREVTEQGDAARGETVFRRNDLSCMKCHAVSKGGGQIGPDLSALGASSPIEYVIMSVLDPDQAIKEAYTTRVVITVQGRVHQGLVADRTANALVLKDATGKETSIPIDDIDDEVEGKSLMPKGLVKFMTHAEFVDLAKFLSMLGKPGEYTVRSTQRLQRWKLLKEVPEALVDAVPDISTFEDLVLRAPQWQSVYAKVNGELPLHELTPEAEQSVIYLQGELNVTQAGTIRGELNSAQGVSLWLNEELLDAKESFEAGVEPGVHRVTLRIDLPQRTAESVKLEFKKPQGSKVDFAVIDGQ